MARQQTITSLPRSPSDDRRSRMIKYSVAMGIRTLCIIACLFVRDWWLLIPAIGAVVLPYIAVVVANVAARNGSAVERPGGLVPVTVPAPGGTASDASGPRHPDAAA